MLGVFFNPADTLVRNKSGVGLAGGGDITIVEMFLGPRTIGDDNRAKRANQGVTSWNSRGHEFIKSWKMQLSRHTPNEVNINKNGSHKKIKKGEAMNKKN
jgi:hypothetical protein